MMRIAIVENGVVVNMILAEAADPALGWVEVPDDSPVGIGWAHDGTDFVPPEPPEPPEPMPPDALTVRLDQLEQRLSAIEAILP